MASTVKNRRTVATRERGCRQHRRRAAMDGCTDVPWGVSETDRPIGRPASATHDEDVHQVSLEIVRRFRRIEGLLRLGSSVIVLLSGAVVALVAARLVERGTFSASEAVSAVLAISGLTVGLGSLAERFLYLRHREDVEKLELQKSELRYELRLSLGRSLNMIVKPRRDAERDGKS